MDQSIEDAVPRKESPQPISVHFRHNIVYATPRHNQVLKHYPHLRPETGRYASIASVIDKKKRADLLKQRDMEWLKKCYKRQGKKFVQIPKAELETDQINIDK